MASHVRCMNCNRPIHAPTEGVRIGDEDGLSRWLCKPCFDKLKPQPQSQASRFAKFMVPAAILGGAAAVIAAPLAVAALGFGAGGIAAGSAAAGMMSSAWTTGVGVGVVSTLQSIGAAGLSAGAAAAVGATGAAVGAGVGAGVAKLSESGDGSNTAPDNAGKTNGSAGNTNSNAGKTKANDGNTKASAGNTKANAGSTKASAGNTSRNSGSFGGTQGVGRY